jgi:hypothetical protein
MSSSRSSCSEIDITIALMAMISLTMSRISRARIGVELGELGEVDRLDQRAEDGALDLVIGLECREIRGRRCSGGDVSTAPAGRRRRDERRAEPGRGDQGATALHGAAMARGARACCTETLRRVRRWPGAGAAAGEALLPPAVRRRRRRALTAV